MASVARITEVISESKESFEDAVAKGIKRAEKSLRNVTGAWVADQSVNCKDGKITDYRVRLKVTFILEDK